MPGVVDAADQGSSNAWWPWALAVLAVVALTALLLVRRSRRAAARKARLDRALTEATELAGHLAALFTRGCPGRGGPGRTARLAAMGAELEAIASQEPDPERKGAIGRVRAQAMALHGVVDSAALSGGQPTEAAIGNLKEQAIALHTVTAQSRAPAIPTPPVTTPPQT